LRGRGRAPTPRFRGVDSAEIAWRTVSTGNGALPRGRPIGRYAGARDGGRGREGVGVNP